MIFSISVYKIVTQLYSEYRENKDFEKLTQTIAQEQVEETIEETIEEVTVPQIIETTQTEGILKEYQILQEENSDMVGWIKIEDTKLDYPVMFTPEEPEYYLKRAFDKSDSESGTPFIGMGCSISPRSDNLILYGHNMKNGTMFKTVMNYCEQSYWEEHPIIQFNTLYEKGEYEVVSAFYIDVAMGNGHLEFYRFINAESEEAYDTFIQECKAISVYETGVDAMYGDDLITLSTCSYHDAVDGRFVIVARKKK